jgi:hypothetical protein
MDKIKAFWLSLSDSNKLGLGIGAVTLVIGLTGLIMVLAGWKGI